MKKLVLMLTFFSMLFVTANHVTADWVEDFEDYAISTPNQWWMSWASPTGQQIWYRETLDTGNIYNTSLVTTAIDTNSSQKLVGDPYNYGATHSRYIDSYTASDTITVTAQVASTSPHSAWPLATLVWVDGVGLGISGNQIAYGLMPLGQKIDATNFTSLMTKVGPTITANTWYDVKIVVHQALGKPADPNAPAPTTDLVDLYYKDAADSTWTEIVTELDTGTLLGDNAKVAVKMCNAASRGHLDNVTLQVRPGWDPVWTEDYEDYVTGSNSWYSLPGVPWDRVGVYNTEIFPDTVGTNTSNKLRGNSWNYYSWFQRTLGAACPTDTIILTGRVATNGADHNAWPSACHIWLGGATVGITGKNISYALMDIGDHVSASESPFTKVTTAIVAPSTWYDVMIKIQPGFDGQKNVADLYYKAETDDYWQPIATDLQTNVGFDGSQYAATLTGVGAYDRSAYVDDLAVYFSPTEPTPTVAYEWEETYDDYTIGDNATFWYWPTFWKRTGTSGGNSSLVDTSVAGNGTQKVRGEPYNYSVWHENSILDSWVLDKTDINQVVLTGQVAVDNLHTSWPFACHIWMGGVGVGIRGNDISYGNVARTGEVTTSTDPFNNLGPIIAADTWYDVMIVYHVVEGDNNDLADLYYKPSADRECAWRVLAEDWATNSDLGSHIATIFCTTGLASNAAYIDNIKLATETGCQQLINDGGALAGDFNEDCHVDMVDLSIMSQQWLLGTE